MKLEITAFVLLLLLTVAVGEEDPDAAVDAASKLLQLEQQPPAPRKRALMHSNNNGIENCARAMDGSDYRGVLNYTESGYTCQAWTSQSPHEHSRTPSNYPDAGLEGDHNNYCRNPDGISRNWCYTTDPNERWDYCDVPSCDTDCAALQDQSDYRGTLSVTESGKTCQAWTSQFPHDHSRTPDYFTDQGLGNHNYCRNPDGETKSWCYTTDPNMRWDYCPIPKCQYNREATLKSKLKFKIGKKNRDCKWASKKPGNRCSKKIKNTTAMKVKDVCPNACGKPGLIKHVYNTCETGGVTIKFNFPTNNETRGTWMGVWPADTDPAALPTPAPIYKFVDCDDCSSGSVTFDANSWGYIDFPFSAKTKWRAFLIASGSYLNSYQAVGVSDAFEMYANRECIPQCTEATDPISDVKHVHATNKLEISKVAFGSCYWPAGQTHGDNLWRHFHENFGLSNHSIWNWLGDNIYADTTNQNTKRLNYNEARDHPYYKDLGPPATGTPVAGTWDDHDYAYNDNGKWYECREQTQAEFVNHFTIPDSDKRHPSKGVEQQEGIYSSFMFKQPGTNKNGIHLINVDARYHRSPTYDNYGPCEGNHSDFLGERQWKWLEKELLERTAPIKIIGSGIQVLPPTYRGRSLNSYCAYQGVDGPAGFEDANIQLGEGPDGNTESYGFEMWSEIPQQRLRLLRLCQESINAGTSKHIIFISGDPHWADIMAKKMPARPEDRQDEAWLYEVTASGIDQNWNQNAPNTNRVSETNVQPDVVSMMGAGGSPACSGSDYHICQHTSNYGGIEVDWEASQVSLNIYTPHDENALAAQVVLPF